MPDSNRKSMVSTMFLTTGIVMIFTQMIWIVALIIDGVITSRMLGPDAYSGVSLFHPFVSILTMIAGFLSVGNHVVCSELVGKGRRKHANSVFSMAVLMALTFAVLIVLFCVVKPDLILRLFGVSIDNHTDFYYPMMDYMTGYLPSVPALLLIQVIGPVIVMDNDKKLFTASSVVLCLTDIAGDLINVFYFHGGVYGMGLATSIAYTLQLLILLTHFLRKNRFFMLSPGRMSVRYLIAISKTGTPAFAQRLASALRNLFHSRLNLAVALSAAGVVAKGIQGETSGLFFCLGIGLGATLRSMTRLNYGSGNARDLKKVFRYAIKVSFIIAFAVGTAVFLAAPLIVKIYGTDPEATELSVFGIRCMAVGLLFDMLSLEYQDYLLGINRQKLLNVLIFLDRFLIPIASILVLGLWFGTKGVLASLAAGKILMGVVIFIVLCIINKRIPRHLNDIMLLPEGFGGSDDDNLYAHIDTMDDVMEISRNVEKFCLDHGAEDRVAKGMALAVEELGGNVVTHGRPTSRGDFGIDLRLYADKKEFILNLRDLCGYFNPTEWYKLHSSDDPTTAIGIRIITGIARDIRYYNAFNSNNIIVVLDRPETQK